MASLPNPHVALLAEKKVRTCGTMSSPLFCAKDVADYIEDAHYRRTLTHYTSDYKTSVLAPDAIGRQQLQLFLTERGLYKYLLQSSRPKAKAFQDFVFDVLVEMRQSVQNVLLFEVLVARARALLDSPVEDLAAGPGYVYFMTAPNIAPAFAPSLKIGFTRRSVDQRLRELRAGNPYLEVITHYACLDPFSEEKHAHQHFAPRHMLLEWFYLTPDEARAYAAARTVELSVPEAGDR